jgi:Ni/Co efflux regulator RcnB
MKRLLLATSIATLLLASTSAFAQSHYGARHDQPVHSGQQHRPDRRHDNGRHLGWQKQSFRRGQRVPVVYLAPRYYVNDYRAYRLAPPPRGYRWVRPYNDSNEYLLVQVATGVIMQVLGY